MIEIKVKDFDLKDTMECGQAFRFSSESFESYEESAASIESGYANFSKINFSQDTDSKIFNIIAHGKVLSAIQKGDILILSCTEEDYNTIWKSFFDLDRDYAQIKAKISENDPIMKEAISFAPGTRLLNQDPYECLIHFIISQNNRIPMIKKVIENLSNKFGKSIDGTYFSFPTSYDLHKASVEEIMECKTGFRAKYIKDAARRIEEENFDPYYIKNLSEQEAREHLMKIHGVGGKVADCVLLFSMQKYGSFPTDVWVKRIMEQFYFNGEETKIPIIHQFAKEKWGEYAGFAQQYLFYYAKEKKIGKK
ncbi:MAG: 8-oxoguanine DNA glycosylase [Defluviitaleaceae bacterium]|nr:8-oxoguanine DNA glycosylase [Defluviitaleaceae bacterium]